MQNFDDLSRMNLRYDLPQYDVIVVGGGPAGGTAAFFLKQAGQKVLVLEKEFLPRYKACGGGISTAFLSRIFPFSFEPVMETRVRGFTYAYKKFTYHIPVQEDSVGMVMRDRFDSYLLDRSGAELRQGILVKKVFEQGDRAFIETQSGELFSARYVVGADGANSIVARSCDLRNKRQLVAAIEVEVPGTPQQIDKFGNAPWFIFGEVRLGYLWIFPKEHTLSVGIASYHPKQGNLRSQLEQVMRRYGLEIGDYPHYGHPIPVYSRAEPLQRGRVLLVGDAAGLADPLSGEGIRFAIKSGKIAAETILHNDTKNYTKRIWQKIGWQHQFARWVAIFFYNTQVLCLAFGAPNPFTTQAIVDLLSDRIPAFTLILRSIATLPVFAITEILALIAKGLGKPWIGEKIRKLVYG